MTSNPSIQYGMQSAGGPACWRKADVDCRQCTYELTQPDIEELDAAFGYVRSGGLDPARIQKAQFPLGGFHASLEAIGRQLESGMGFCLIRGIPIERYNVEDAGILLCGIGAYFGRQTAQNAKGEVLNHVRDARVASTQDGPGRGYQGTGALPFHSDSCDIVGLLCIRAAKSGGRSAIASSYAVHDAILSQRPDLPSVLYEPFYIDRHGEGPRGAPPYYSTPVFMWHNGRLFSRFNPGYVYSAQRYPETPRLTERQMDAIDAFNGVCASDEFRLDMTLRPGDLQLLNNNVIVHARSSYEDFPEPAQKRHLLRLWLFTGSISAVPVPMRDRYRDMEAWQAKAHVPQPPRCD